MTSKEDRFEANMARFLDPEKTPGDGKALDAGGQRVELMNQAILETLDNLDNMHDECLRAFDRFCWTQAELESAQR